MKVLNNVIIGENKGVSQTLMLNNPTPDPSSQELSMFFFNIENPEERYSIEGIPSTIEFNIEDIIFKVHLDAKGDAANGSSSTEIDDLWYSGISLDSSSNSIILCAIFHRNSEDGKFYLMYLMLGGFTS